jgi:hypothetical protein
MSHRIHVPYGTQEWEFLVTTIVFALAIGAIYFGAWRHKWIRSKPQSSPSVPTFSLFDVRGAKAVPLPDTGSKETRVST